MELPTDEKVHCIELSTGRQHSGFLLLSDRRISLEMFGYDERFYVPIHSTIAVRTETNHVVSLLDNVGADVAGSRGWLGDPPMATYHQEVISNLALVGRDAWHDCENVRRATFKVDGCDAVLRHVAKKREAARAQLGDGRDRTLLIAAFDGGSVRIDYAPQFSFELDSAVQVDAYFDVEFSTALTIRECLGRLFYLVRFFSLSTGVGHRPTDLTVFTASRADVIAAVERNAPIYGYAVHYPWWGEPSNDEKTKPHGCLFISANDHELEATSRALVAWQARRGIWAKTIALMVTSTSLQGELSPHRLVTAARWLEAIPSAASMQAISDIAIEKIAAAAVSVAAELGYKELDDRIKNAIKKVRNESNAVYFTRLTAIVRQNFGSNILGDEAVGDLRRAWQLRGEAAHGHGKRGGIDDPDVFQRSLFALEALCLLLTASDLPMTELGRKRVREHPLVRSYLLCGSQ